MDFYSMWKTLLSRFRKQLPLDIEHCSPIALRQIILDVRTPAWILDRIAQTYCDDQEILRDLVRCPSLSETTLAFIALTASEEIKKFISGTRVMDLVVADETAPAMTGATALSAPRTGPAKQEAGKKKLNLPQQLQKMPVPQKIKLAMTGGKEARRLLIRDMNKQVAIAVMQNARITDGEIETFAQSKNLTEDILRIIGTNPEWSKRYAVAAALVNNPKTPIGVAVPFVNRMTDRELAMLEKNRNVSEAVRSAARGLLAKRKRSH